MGKIILVVEDDIKSLTLTTDLLTMSGYNTLKAMNGQQGIDLARSQKPDLILMDIMMPEVDGLAATSTLKTDETTKHIPVIMLSAIGYDLNKQIAKKMGADGYITKPFTRQELIDAINPFLGSPDVSVKKVLIFEDEPKNLKLIRDLLQKFGYRTLEATDGEQGIAIAKSEIPDLILMDIMMPKMDGLEATRVLKADAATKGIPIIALTSKAMKGDREEALAVGCNGYIAKPVDIKELMENIRHYC